jgi:hypothetical protein
MSGWRGEDLFVWDFLNVSEPARPPVSPFPPAMQWTSIHIIMYTHIHYLFRRAKLTREQKLCTTSLLDVLRNITEETLHH